MSEEEKADKTVTAKTQDEDAEAVENNNKTKSITMANPTDPSPDNDVKNEPVPNNMTPREEDPDEETYIYRDFSTLPIPPEYSNSGGDGALPQPQSQKLPAKLASMLSDIDLTSVITWLPHGRSWRVINRDLFAEQALPRYFGHNNYSSFVRIINAWGFRRITRGPNRDSYYHELFLRGRPDLHPRMKRLGASYRKTPVQKDANPDFFELSQRNPLPMVEFHRSIAPTLPTAAFARPSIAQAQGPQAAAPSNINLGGHHLDMSPYSQMPGGMPGGGSSLFRNDVTRSATAQSSLGDLGRISQLQRDNEDLQLRIAEIEMKHRMNREIIMQQMGVASAQGFMNSSDNMLLRAYNVGQAQLSLGSSHPPASLDDDQRKALADMLSKQSRHDST